MTKQRISCIIRLARGSKASAKSLERKILNSFSDAVGIAQEYKSSTSLVQDSLKANTGDLFGKNENITLKDIPVELKQQIPWQQWDDYEKIVDNGHLYAKVGNRLYSHHAVDRMQPSGNRFGNNIYQGITGDTYGRSIAPQFIEDIINSVEPQTLEDGKLLYKSGSVEIIINTQGAIITVMTYK